MIYVNFLFDLKFTSIENIKKINNLKITFLNNNYSIAEISAIEINNNITTEIFNNNVKNFWKSER